VGFFYLSFGAYGIMSRRMLISLIIVIAAVLIAISFIPVAAYVWWASEASGQTQTGNLIVNIEGKTELIGEDGQPLKILYITKFALLPLAFYIGDKEVTAMRVTVTWTASGQDVNWDTLTITISASGTGGYSSSTTSQSKTGSTIFTLPISTSQLGRTPSSGEKITWKLTINVQGTITDIIGNTLTASANPIINTVTTTWYEPTFTVSASTSTSTTTTDTTSSTTSGDTTVSGGTSSGGGCGGPGKHLVWVHNITPLPNVTEILQPITYSLILTEITLIAKLISNLKRKKKAPKNE